MNYKKLFDVTNKSIIILGGAGLLGREIVKSLASLGANITILDYKRINKKTFQFKNKINFEYFDIKDESYLKIKFKKIIKKIRKIDVFINASYPHTEDWSKNTFKEATYENIKLNTEYQLVTTAWFSKCIANQMIKNKTVGSIINLGSIYGVVGQNLNNYKKTKMNESITYSMAKGGIINLTKQMASYYGKYNIRVNCISPGGVKGPVIGLSKKQDKNFIEQYSKNVPMRRIAKSSEICGATIFLASNASSYVTGINLLVDGGYTAI